MELETFRDRLEATCEFPIEQSTIVEAVGDVEIETGAGGSEAVETILERTDETSYESPRAVSSTIQGTVNEEYVGREQYDDRGGAPVNHDQESL